MNLPECPSVEGHDSRTRATLRRLDQLFQQHLEHERRVGGVHPDGCYYCGGDHLTTNCFTERMKR